MDEVLFIARSIASGLAALHPAIVHRDRECCLSMGLALWGQAWSSNACVCGARCRRLAADVKAASRLHLSLLPLLLAVKPANVLLRHSAVAAKEGAAAAAAAAGGVGAAGGRLVVKIADCESHR